MATLFLFAGLPGTGKTTLSRLLAQHLGITHLRIDTVERGLRDLCGIDVEGEGYRLSYRIAADNLRLGQSVVADCCNPIELTRREWRDVASASGAAFIDIEIGCSNVEEHRERVERRRAAAPGTGLPDWERVANREYHPWTEPRLAIDTAGASIEASLAELLRRLEDRESGLLLPVSRPRP